MVISLEQIGVGLVALLGLLIVALALWALARFLLGLGTFVTFTGFGIITGISTSIILDVRLILLVTLNTTTLAYYIGGNWRYLSSIFAIELLSLSALYIISFLNINIRDIDEDQVTKEIMEIVKAGAGFWGLLGVIFSFTICTFLITNIWKLHAFNGIHGGKISFFESLGFAIQIIIDMFPINIEKSFNFYISKLSVTKGNYYIGSLLFVYQILILASFTQVVVYFWRLGKDKKNKNTSSN